MSRSKKIKSGFNSKTITRLDFCATHFNAMQLPSDMFYVKLANSVYPLVKTTFSTEAGFAPETSKRVAIALACYVEDLVAGSGVWAAFTSLYKKKYKKCLPFYNIREISSIFPYDDEKPSFHAVLFLLWYMADTFSPGILMNPNNPGLRMLALALMPDLETAYVEAPETPARPILLPEEEIGIPLFFQIRRLCAWLCDRCYLTRINDREKVAKDFESFIDEMYQSVGSLDKGAQTYGIDSFVPMNALIGPLAIPAYEWLAEIVSLYHESEEEQFIPILATVKSRPYQYYRYESVGESELVLEDVNGEKLTLSASSMPDGRFAPEIIPGRSAMLSLVFLDGIWLMNGIGIQGMPPEVYDDYRETHRNNVKNSKKAYTYLMKTFDKQRIGVCGSYDEYLKRAFGDRVPECNSDPALLADIREAGNLLYFVNRNGIVSMLPGWADSVKIKDNPFYDSEKAANGGVGLIMNHSLCTPEMREYIIKNKLIPDAALNSAISPEEGRKLFQRNIRFLNACSDRDTMPFMLNT